MVRCRLVDATERRYPASDSEPLYSQHQSVRYFGRKLKDKEGESGEREAHGRAARMYKYYADYTSRDLSDYIDAKTHFVAGGEMAEAVRLVQALSPLMDRQEDWQVALSLNTELRERVVHQEAGSE